MKLRILFIIIFFITYRLISNCQVISGIILDSETKSPIGFAYLYFSGTFVGTQSDQDGKFELHVTRETSIPLTISAIGYYSATLTDYLSGKSLVIYLTPKVYELKEVSIGSKSLARERRANLIIFRNEFLGTTNNAKYCKILNENDITFNYESDRDTLKAFASKPIIIDNRALGYKITYYLDKFEYDRSNTSVSFTGNILFEKDLSADEPQNQIFNKRRIIAYLGSRMHFFRSLWANDIKSNDFLVYNAAEKYLTYKDIVVQDVNNNKYLKYDGKLSITYSLRMPGSYIIFLKDEIFFDEDGYFDPSGIAWEGTMADQRIADWLPYEYSVREY